MTFDPPGDAPYNLPDADDGPSPFNGDNEPADEDVSCGECGGEGFISDGGCGGGCEFCRPFPKCHACDGTGRNIER